jgi:hypothetical protein
VVADRQITLHTKTTADGRGLLEAARDLEKTADGVEKLGGKMKDTAEDSKRLGQQIEETSKKAQDLKLQIARTGDVTLFGDLRRQESLLGKLEKIREELEKVDDAAAGVSASLGGAAAGGGIGGILKGAPSAGGASGPLIAGGAAAIAALSPAIGATVAAAVLGSVGTGGVIGGVALAAQDTRVKAAFKEVGKEMFEGVGDAASPFVQPLIQAASTFGDAWRQEAPEFRKNFETLSEAVDPLAKGLTGFIHNLGPGLGSAFKASIPLAEEFGEELAAMGTDVSDFLRAMARSAPGAKIALNDLFTVVDFGLDVLGDGTEILSKTYEGMRKLGLVAPPEWLLQTSRGTAFVAFDILNHELEKSVNNLKNVLTPTEELERAQEDAADAAKRQADAIAQLNKKVDAYYDAILGPLDAEERWHRAILATKEALAENGKTLAINTRAGLDNRDAIEEQFAAAKNRLDMGTLTEEQYQREIDNLGALKKQFKDTTGFIDGLIAAYRRVPSEVRSTLSVTAEGSGLGILLRLLKAQATGGVPFSMGEHSGSQIKQLVGATAGLPGPGHGAFFDLPARASGGPVLAGHAYMVGERGPEPFIPSTNGTILPSGAGVSVSLRATSGGAGPIDAIIRLLLPYISAEVQHLGGDGNVLGVRRVSG